MRWETNLPVSNKNTRKFNVQQSPSETIREVEKIENYVEIYSWFLFLELVHKFTDINLIYLPKTIKN